MPCKYVRAEQCSSEMVSKRMCLACYEAGRRARQGKKPAGRKEPWVPPPPLGTEEMVQIHRGNFMTAKWVRGAA